MVFLSLFPHLETGIRMPDSSLGSCIAGRSPWVSAEQLNRRISASRAWARLVRLGIEPGMGPTGCADTARHLQPHMLVHIRASQVWGR